MEKHKKKEITSESQTGKRRAAVPRTHRVKAPGEVSPPEVLKIWQDEVSELKAEEFNSVEEAVSFVADRVLKRLGFNTQGEERQFLETLLNSDGSVVDELRSLVKITTG